ncbi:methylated-DNA--[protein]-cysteine S-methyltransferase [Thermodesulfobacteriota bacterium]
MEGYDASGSFAPGDTSELSVTWKTVTPEAGRKIEETIQIAYAFHPSPFGTCFVATNEFGICSLGFVQKGNKADLIDRLKSGCPNASLIHAPDEIRPVVEKIFNFSALDQPVPLILHIKGTPFQIKVWKALTKIPLGKVVTYGNIARHIGLPKAARAVGNAVGQNPISFLVPCHRVIRQSGDFGNYGEGPTRKKAILGWEAAQCLINPRH